MTIDAKPAYYIETYAESSTGSDDTGISKNDPMLVDDPQTDANAYFERVRDNIKILYWKFNW